MLPGDDTSSNTSITFTSSGPRPHWEVDVRLLLADAVARFFGGDATRERAIALCRHAASNLASIKM